MIWHYVNGKRVDGPAPRRPYKHAVLGEGSERGFSFQLAKNRSYIPDQKFTPEGWPAWTSKQEAREIAARAQGKGDDIAWERDGGLQNF